MSAKLPSQRRISPHEGQEGGSIGPASAAASFGWRNGCASPGEGVDSCRQRSQIGNPGCYRNPVLKYNIRTRSLADQGAIEDVLAVEDDLVPFDRADVLGAGLRPGLPLVTASARPVRVICLLANWLRDGKIMAIESRIISCQSRQREDCFQKAVIKRGLRRMRRSVLRARSSSSQ